MHSSDTNSSAPNDNQTDNDSDNDDDDGQDHGKRSKGLDPAMTTQPSPSHYPQEQEQLQQQQEQQQPPSSSITMPSRQQQPLPQVMHSSIHSLPPPSSSSIYHPYPSARSLPRPSSASTLPPIYNPPQVTRPRLTGTSSQGRTTFPPIRSPQYPLHPPLQTPSTAAQVPTGAITFIPRLTPPPPPPPPPRPPQYTSPAHYTSPPTYTPPHPHPPSYTPPSQPSPPSPTTPPVLMAVHANPYAYTPTGSPLYLAYSPSAIFQSTPPHQQPISPSQPIQPSIPFTTSATNLQHRLDTTPVTTSEIQPHAETRHQFYTTTPHVGATAALGSSGKEPVQKQGEMKRDLVGDEIVGRKRGGSVMHGGSEEKRRSMSVSDEDTGKSMKRAVSASGMQRQSSSSSTPMSPSRSGLVLQSDKRRRVQWTPELHERFVQAVAQVGLQNAVPKIIMQLMDVEHLTRENVASHLQKYREGIRKKKILEELKKKQEGDEGQAGGSGSVRGDEKKDGDDARDEGRT